MREDGAHGATASDVRGGRTQAGNGFGDGGAAAAGSAAAGDGADSAAAVHDGTAARDDRAAVAAAAVVGGDGGGDVGDADDDVVVVVGDDDGSYSMAAAVVAVVVALRMPTGDACVVDNDTADDNAVDSAGAWHCLDTLDTPHLDRDQGWDHQHRHDVLLQCHCFPHPTVLLLLRHLRCRSRCSRYPRRCAATPTSG